MTLTPSEVESLSRSLSFWEYVEYGAEFFVALACVGEYVADFTKCFEGRARKTAKDRLSKRSTLLLIFALTVELGCLIRTNILSDRMFGSVRESATAAATNAGTALTNAGTATNKADAAGRKADQVETTLGVIEGQTSKLRRGIVLQGSRAELLQEPSVIAKLQRALLPFAGQKAEVRLVLVPPNSLRFSTERETFEFASALFVRLLGLHWRVPPQIIEEGLQRKGVLVKISPRASASTRKAADALAAALTDVPLLRPPRLAAHSSVVVEGLKAAPRQPLMVDNTEVFSPPFDDDTIVVEVGTHP